MYNVYTEDLKNHIAARLSERFFITAPNFRVNTFRVVNLKKI